MKCHPREHRYWAAALVVFGLISLGSSLVKTPGFWSSYLLDIFGPAWIYILIRGLFSKNQPAMLSRYLSPEAALILVLVVGFIIEGMQYLSLYEATFDPLDFVAYGSLVVAVYAVDRRWRQQKVR